MARRPGFLLLLLLLVGIAVPAGLLAQMESGERGILPIDSSGTLEITGIQVDATGPDAQSARLAGWRMAQREGFKALWAKTNSRPASEAPNLPDPVLDGLVSSIVVEREQIGPTRYIATLGVLFDRARSAALLGIGGEVRRSVPMLLIPVLETAGTEMTVELRNPWQRAWAEFRTSQSPIDYVRVTGLGIDPLLVNAAQVDRPGRGWWRNIVDLYGAADILVAEVQLHRLYPGGPAYARFIGYHGPDRDPIGTFTLRARDSADLPRMMREGVQRMDQLFTAAHSSGRLVRDPTLDIPEPPPPPPEEIIDEEVEDPARSTGDAGRLWTYQVQIVSPDVTVYNFAVAHLRTSPGVEQVVPVSIFPGAVSYVNVTYRGDLANLRAALAGRGWNVTQSGPVLRMSSGGAPPPPPPPPPPPQQPQPQPQPQQQPPPPGAGAGR